MPTKIVKKSKYWWRHGKHKGLLGICIKQNREAQTSKSRRRGLDRASETVAELFSRNR